MDSRLAIDTGVLLLYFFIIIFIGLRMGRKEDNLEDFALGGRRIPWWAVLASLVAAETSAGTFFGTPGEGFTQRNYTYLQLAFGTILARIVRSPSPSSSPLHRVPSVFSYRSFRHEDQEHGERDFSSSLACWESASASARWRDHGGHLALSFPVSLPVRFEYLCLGHHFRLRYHHGFYTRRCRRVSLKAVDVDPG